jgi:hypothetical protein
MTPLRPILLGLALVYSNPAASQQAGSAELPTAESIMARVAANQDHAEAERDHYIYMQHAHIISRKNYQPVVVRTTMARNIPFAVRTLLGTSLPGLGFTVVYAPQPDGVWFPVSFGTEFKIHVLFFFSREIIIDAQNSDFEKTHVTSKIVDGGDTVKPQ